jgi:2-hydroxychromene-2-carboxylate isomerase
VELTVTFDHRCPFARIAALTTLDALADGLDATVTFAPFNLGQAHVEEGGSPVWERPDEDSGLASQRVAVAVRDRHPEAFAAVQRGLFDLRHVDGGDLADRDSLSSVLDSAGLDARAVLAAADDGATLAIVRDEHDGLVLSHDIWGVPTFIVDDRAAFVRLTEIPPDGHESRATIERIVDMLSGWPQLNEFKHTTIDR